MNNSMILITGTLDGQNKTFKMIPATKDCPYVECLYDTNAGVLAILSKDTKQHFTMVVKIDDNGDPLQRNKPAKDHTNNIIPGASPYRQERVTVTVPHEYYLMNEDEVRTFVNTFASNAKEYDWEQYLFVAPPEGEAEAPDSLVKLATEADLKVVKDNIPEPAKT